MTLHTAQVNVAGLAIGLCFLPETLPLEQRLPLRSLLCCCCTRNKRGTRTGYQRASLETPQLQLATRPRHGGNQTAKVPGVTRNGKVALRYAALATSTPHSTGGQQDEHGADSPVDANATASDDDDEVAVPVTMSAADAMQATVNTNGDPSQDALDASVTTNDTAWTVLKRLVRTPGVSFTCVVVLHVTHAHLTSVTMGHDGSQWVNRS